MEELKRTDYAAWKAFVDGRYNEEVDILAFQDTVVRALESIIAKHQGERLPCSATAASSTCGPRMC